ncbi:chymotrypsin-2-like [Cotesia glomerata]|uniref:Peptidase S1 domain-containing protein n=1 Tax=Cotesia glomerata TaxID=32391 RepID=A0AAV7J9K8_COTGL|nr:chymotrypsin-2-like [Cotesia glomerata]KAH0568738.1 hypothetical protein KQX54_021428 [Cotesia glomerata]
MVSLISTAVNLLVFVLITISTADGGAPAKILEGTDAEPEKLSYMASLRRYNIHVCGGAYISPCHVLTAAHCFVGRANPPYTEGLVVVGKAALNRYAGVIHEVEKVTPHSDFERGTKSRWRNDIAVVKLKKNITISPYEKPIALPTVDTPSEIIAILGGWGQTTLRGAETDRLQQMMVHVISNEECNKRDADVLPSNLCGYNGRGHGFCNGDSGGPLVYNGTVVGIVSFSIVCGLGYPDTYTRVYYYIDFINKTMNES